MAHLLHVVKELCVNITIYTLSSLHNKNDFEDGLDGLVKDKVVDIFFKIEKHFFVFSPRIR